MSASEKVKSLAEIFAQWRSLQAEESGLRAREAAARLSVTEAELTASQEHSHLLSSDDIATWMEALLQNGRFMWLARTEGAVLEVDDTLSLAAEGSQLRLFSQKLQIRLARERCRYALATEQAEGPPLAVQFFDPTGVAVLKIYLKQRRRTGAVRRLLEPWYREKPANLDLSVVGSPAVSPAEPAESLEPQAYRNLLQEASASGSPVTLSLENGGCQFSADTTPGKLVEMGPWYNILDRGFNLHLREDRIATCHRQTTPEGRTQLTLREVDGTLILILTRHGV